MPPPLAPVDGIARQSAAEEARTLVASTRVATLASLSGDGGPWASFVAYGLLDDGSPVLCVSRLAEHGRNLARDPRASLSIVTPRQPADPLAGARVTLAGVAERPVGDALAAAQAAHIEAVPAAHTYMEYSDFTTWVLRVERVRWVGGYGRMDSASAADYTRAQPDPVVPDAAGAIAHLNDDHADALLLMARRLGGYPDATGATCTGADRYGLDLWLRTARGEAPARIGFASPVAAAAGLRAATVELVRRARAEPA